MQNNLDEGKIFNRMRKKWGVFVTQSNEGVPECRQVSWQP